MKTVFKIFIFALLGTFAACTSYEADQLVNPNNTGVNPNCSAPSNLSVSAFSSTTNSVTISITPSGNENVWQIQYGPTGFVIGQGTTIISTVTNFSVYGLNPAINYQFYVRAKCEQNGFSAWVGPIALNGGGGAGGGGTGGGGTSGDYFPMALNNSWTYTTSAGQSNQYTMASMSTFNGMQYFSTQISGTSSNGTNYNTNVNYRKTNGDYYYRIDAIATQQPNNITSTMSGYEKLILKDYLAVGDTWTNDYQQTSTFSGSQFPIPNTNLDSHEVNTIDEKGISVTFNGTTYNDVIHVKTSTTLSTSTNFMGQVIPGSTTNIFNEVWYAKNIGMIKTTSSSSQSNNTNLLTTYTIH